MTPEAPPNLTAVWPMRTLRALSVNYKDGLLCPASPQPVNQSPDSV